MKKIVNLTIGLLTATFLTYAVDVRLGWTHNPPAEMVERYVIFMARGTNTSFTPMVTIPGTTNAGVVRNLAPGMYRFVVVAQNGVGSAPPSNEVVVPTNSPTTTQSVILLDVK